MTQESDIRPFWLLRRWDQAAVAGLLLLVLLAMIVYWAARGGCSGRLVEADRAGKQEYSFLVDVNRATWPELAELPGIGEITARKIVASRKKDGPFTCPDDLERIRGIGKKTVARIRPFLLIGKNDDNRS